MGKIFISNDSKIKICYLPSMMKMMLENEQQKHQEINYECPTSPFEFETEPYQADSAVLELALETGQVLNCGMLLPCVPEQPESQACATSFDSF